MAETDEYGVDLATVQPMHEWSDADGGGHNCDLCPSESIWKCDERAHEYVTDPIEKVLSQHQRMDLPDDGGILCLCAETFGGPVWHRRHIVGVIRAVLDGRHDPFTQGPFADVEVDDADAS